MKYSVEMISGGIIYLRSLMKIGRGVQTILRLFPQQFERLQYWCYLWEGFMKFAVEMASGSMIYIPSLIKFGSGVQKLLRGGGFAYRDTHSKVMS
jgi:hypothetical protein